MNSYYYKFSRKHSAILQRMDQRSIYQDYSGSEVDVKAILDRRRFLHVFESPPNFELMDMVVELLEKKSLDYLYVNFDLLPSLEAKYSDKDEFWGLVAQSIIAYFQSSTNKNIVLIFNNLINFRGAKTNEEHLAKWEYFAEIVETIHRKLEHVNIIVATELPQVTDFLEGAFLSLRNKTQLSRIIQKNQRIPCREASVVRHELHKRAHARLDHARDGCELRSEPHSVAIHKPRRHRLPDGRPD